MSGRYLTDRELEEALYEDDDDLCRDYIDRDLESSDEESEVDQGEQEHQDRFFEETENESSCK